MDKKGLSPVIATTLLIVIVLILAMIIFLWARSFLTEKNVKFGEPVERACDDISFRAEIIGNKLSVVNEGNVPLYNFEIYSINGGRVLVDSAVCEKTMNAGEDCDMALTLSHSGEKIRVVPGVLSEKGESKEPYMCIDAGIEITAK